MSECIDSATTSADPLIFSEEGDDADFFRYTL